MGQTDDIAAGGARLRGRRREQETLEGLLAGERSGSEVLVVRGEPGIGKTALLEYLVERASGCQLARATGVQAEMELPFAGLQQLLGSMLGPLERLPDPQRESIEVAFALRAGPPPDRLGVGVAVQGLLAELAKERPLVCVVDDAQWLDRVSAQTLAFVARRLRGVPVALVLAVREPDNDRIFDGLPELVVGGLGPEDARDMLTSVIGAPLDERVVDRVIAEARGNPLALMELPHGLSAAELAGGFGLPTAWPLSQRIEESFLRRLQSLPEATRRLLVLAAAEPLGDPVLLLRAAERLGLGAEAARPAEADGWLELGALVRFRHPLVRSAVYGAAPLADRQAVHGALAEATDARTDPDRRAWHRAHAAPAPDDDVARELESSAQRAQARGGMAAAAAFLERASALSPEPRDRARRALAAGQANQLAGAPEAALRLLDAAATWPLDPLDDALVHQLRGRVALHLGRSADAAARLVDSARRLEPLDPELARDVHLEALYAAGVAGRLGPGIAVAARAARRAPPRSRAPRAVDLLVDGLAVRFTDGYSAGAAILKRAVTALREEEGGYELDMTWPWLGARVAADLFDEESTRLLATRHARIARDAGAFGVLPVALTYLAGLRTIEGRLDDAAALTEEVEAMVEASGGRRISAAKLLVAAYRGRLAETEQLLAELQHDNAGGEGGALTFGEHAQAVLCNGLGRYDAAVAVAERASAQDELTVSSWSLAELVEAAARSGNAQLAADALERLCERTRVAGTDWAIGIETRSRALVSDADVAEGLYREAIDRLGRSRLALELARAHLLYGEWLRRERRRRDARGQLRRAQEMFVAAGAGAFAERAARELLATGETARTRSGHTFDELTPHELRIARMARDGASNPEIATQLFISRKTVEHHLSKVFLKLGISSRAHLHRVLPAE